MTVDMRVADVVQARPIRRRTWNLGVVAWLVVAQLLRGFDLIDPGGPLAEVPGGDWWPLAHFVVAGIFAGVLYGIVNRRAWTPRLTDVGIVAFAAVYITRQVAIIDTFGWDRIAVSADAITLVLLLASAHRNNDAW